MTHLCKSIGCANTIPSDHDFCDPCRNRELDGFEAKDLAERYPDYYKSVGDMTEIDTYAVHHLFKVQDHSGCLQSASRKLLLSGASKTTYTDIREARDTLTRWLQLNRELNTSHEHRNQGH